MQCVMSDSLPVPDAISDIVTCVQVINVAARSKFAKLQGSFGIVMRTLQQ